MADRNFLVAKSGERFGIAVKGSIKATPTPSSTSVRPGLLDALKPANEASGVILTGNGRSLQCRRKSVFRRGILALTHICCCAGLRRTDQPRLQEIEFCSSVHLALNELQACDLSFRLPI